MSNRDKQTLSTSSRKQLSGKTLRWREFLGGRAGETEGSRELGRIEDIGRAVLVEHFIDFTDQRIEPPNKTNHRSAQDAVS